MTGLYLPPGSQLAFGAVPILTLSVDFLYYLLLIVVCPRTLPSVFENTRLPFDGAGMVVNTPLSYKRLCQGQAKARARHNRSYLRSTVGIHLSKITELRNYPDKD